MVVTNNNAVLLHRSEDSEFDCLETVTREWSVAILAQGATVSAQDWLIEPRDHLPLRPRCHGAAGRAQMAVLLCPMSELDSVDSGIFASTTDCCVPHQEL